MLGRWTLVTRSLQKGTLSSPARARCRMPRPTTSSVPKVFWRCQRWRSFAIGFSPRPAISQRHPAGTVERRTHQRMAIGGAAVYSRLQLPAGSGSENRCSDARLPGRCSRGQRAGDARWRRILRRGYGMSDLEAKVAATPATNYRLASMTKQFTAASILLLAEEGRLKLEDPMRKWLPSLPAATDGVTIRQLLTHTGGLIDYEDVMRGSTAQQLHDADVLRLLEGQDRSTSPRECNIATATAATLLSLIVARVSGSDFAFVSARADLPPAENAEHGGIPAGNLPLRSAPMGTVCIDHHGSAPIRVSPAQCWAMAASIPRSRIWRNGMPRYTTAACSSLRIAANGVCARRRRPMIRRAVWIRLAHHRRIAMAFGRDHGVSQCHHPLSKARFTVMVFSNRNEPEPYPVRSPSRNCISRMPTKCRGACGGRSRFGRTSAG